MITDKSLLKKIKIRNVLHHVQIICTLLVPIIVIGAFFINNKSYFEGTFALIYAMILCGVSLATIIVSLIKIRIEASIMNMLENGIDVKSREIYNTLCK